MREWIKAMTGGDSDDLPGDFVPVHVPQAALDR